MLDDGGDSLVPGLQDQPYEDAPVALDVAPPSAGTPAGASAAEGSVAADADADVEDDAAERPVRPAAVLPAASPVRAVAGAAVAVAGVALAVGALLAVTGDGPSGSPAVVEAASSAEQVPADDLPAVVPSEVASPAAAVVVTPAVTAAAVPPPAAPAPAASTAPAAAPRPPVTVLNNSTVGGLAARAAARFERAGWPVRGTGNFTGRLRATTIYFEPGQRASAERFAATFRGITRVLPRPSNIPGPAGLTVVLTRDYAS